jgi:thermitase
MMKFGTSLFGFAFALPIFVSAQTSQDIVPGRVIVKYRGEALNTLAKLSIRGVTANRVPEIGVETVQLPSNLSVASALQTLRNDPNVVYAEPVYRRKYHFDPNDTRRGEQYGIDQVRGRQAWDIQRGSNNTIVAVIDSGFRVTHEEFVGRIAPGGFNFGNNNTDLTDNVGHGTHCAGLAVAGTNNGRGIASLSFGARLLPLKLGDQPTSDNSMRAITYAANNGARVISMSYGGGFKSQAEQDAINFAWSRNVVLFGSAGNDDSTQMNFPGASDNVISVGSTNNLDRKSDFSNFGPWVLIAAPGSAMLSTVTTGDTAYDLKSGTSMACPWAAGLAALMIGRNSAISNVRVRDILRNTCDPVQDTGREANWARWGRINAFRAIQQVDVLLPIQRTYVEAGIPSIDGRLEGVNVSNATSAQAVSLMTSVDEQTLSVGSINRGTLGNMASVTGSFRITRPTALADLRSLSLNYRARAVQGSSSLIMLWNFRTSAWVQVSSLGMTSKANSVSVSVVGNDLQNFVSANGTLRYMVRNVLPGRIRTSGFVLHVDQMDLAGQFVSTAP